MKKYDMKYVGHGIIDGHEPELASLNDRSVIYSDPDSGDIALTVSGVFSQRPILRYVAFPKNNVGAIYCNTFEYALYRIGVEF
jgi:hypothetical protein